MLGESSALYLCSFHFELILTLGRHYVSFIRKRLEDRLAWVLFNDEKVVEAVDIEAMRKFAYVYFFKRV